jgi:hypothetical protein
MVNVMDMIRLSFKIAPSHLVVYHAVDTIVMPMFLSAAAIVKVLSERRSCQAFRIARGMLLLWCFLVDSHASAWFFRNLAAKWHSWRIILIPTGDALAHVIWVFVFAVG